MTRAGSADVRRRRTRHDDALGDAGAFERVAALATA
jgi:hypothetical protein